LLECAHSPFTNVVSRTAQENGTILIGVSLEHGQDKYKPLEGAE
jgi:hypothetical protein